MTIISLYDTPVQYVKYRAIS